MIAGLLALGMSAQAKDYKYQTFEGDMTQTRIYTLDNGLKVYLSVNKEKPRIQTFIAVRTGSKNDPAETTGLAHYLEHLMFKGTDKFGVTDPKAEAPLLFKSKIVFVFSSTVSLISLFCSTISSAESLPFLEPNRSLTSVLANLVSFSL